MAEKHLGEANWKTFAKGKTYKDADFLKALAAFGRAEKSPPAERLEALEALDQQADKLVRANAKDKELAGYIAEVDKAVRREKTELLKAVAEAKAKQVKEAQAAKSAADDEADSPALLTTKLLSFLRAVQAKDDLRLNALVGIAGKLAHAVVDRASIGGSHRTLLQEYIGQSGIKFIKGEVLREAKCITFVLESGAGGPLAAKLKLGVAQQTGQKLKLRVRALDSDQVEETGDEADDTLPPPAPPVAEGAAPAIGKDRFAAVTAAVKAAAAAGHPQADKAKALLVQAMQAQGRDAAAALAALGQAEALLKPAASGAAAAPAASGAAAAPAASGAAPAAAPASPAKAQYEALQQQLAPQVAALARGLPADAADAAAQVQKAFAMAGEMAGKGQFEQAHAVLRRLADGGVLARLQAARGAAAPAAAPSAAAAPGAAPAPGGRKVLFTQARLRWDGARKKVQEELTRLEQTILAEAQGEPDFSEIAAQTKKLYTLLDRLDNRLIDRLDDAYTATTPEAEQQAFEAAAQVVKEYNAFVDADPVLAMLDNNPFGSFDIKRSVKNTLAGLASRFA